MKQKEKKQHKQIKPNKVELHQQKEKQKTSLGKKRERLNKGRTMIN